MGLYRMLVVGLVSLAPMVFAVVVAQPHFRLYVALAFILSFAGLYILASTGTDA